MWKKKKKGKDFEVYVSEYTSLGIVYCLKIVL
jgi:hypothetical protein